MLILNFKQRGESQQLRHGTTSQTSGGGQVEQALVPVVTFYTPRVRVSLTNKRL